FGALSSISTPDASGRETPAGFSSTSSKRGSFGWGRCLLIGLLCLGLETCCLDICIFVTSCSGGSKYPCATRGICWADLEGSCEVFVGASGARFCAIVGISRTDVDCIMLYAKTIKPRYPIANAAYRIQLNLLAGVTLG